MKQLHKRLILQTSVRGIKDLAQQGRKFNLLWIEQEIEIWPIYQRVYTQTTPVLENEMNQIDWGFEIKKI